ncbi:MAG: hypothetical protein ACOYXT_12030 [Bacteroidota bacterium]
MTFSTSSKTPLIFLFAFFTLSLAKAQKLGCPIYEGKLVEVDWEKFPIGTSLDGVIITSLVSDTVRSLSAGTVVDVAEGRTMALIRTEGIGLFNYFELETVYLRKGEKILAGTIIGKAKAKANHFEIRFDVVTKEKPAGGDAIRYSACPR